MSTVRICRDMMRKTKAHLQYSLAEDIKDRKKDFYKNTSSKRKIEGNSEPLLNHVGILVRTYKKEKLLSTFLASVFTAELSPHESQISEVREEGWGRKISP